MFGLDRPFGLADDNDDEIEAPGAPLQKRYRLSRVDRDEDNSGVSVALFNWIKQLCLRLINTIINLVSSRSLIEEKGFLSFMLLSFGLDKSL